jgi:hypothetical protein
MCSLPKRRAINDVIDRSDDAAAFVALAKQRVQGRTARSIRALCRGAAEVLSRSAHPGDRAPVEESFELVEETARASSGRCAVRRAGRQDRQGGVLEATDQTTIMGFTDDIVVRVEGNLNRSRIDVRSASRYGVVDLGRMHARCAASWPS